VDLNFGCSQSLVRSFGYETYPAKWKRSNEELMVLLPVFDKNNVYFTCNLQTQVQYYASAGSRDGVDLQAAGGAQGVDGEAQLRSEAWEVPTGTAPAVSGGRTGPSAAAAAVPAKQ
jgi:hypothetical protein